MKQILVDIKKDFIANSTKESAAATEKFIPGYTKVYGVKMPLLNTIAKKYKSGGFDLIEELWKGNMYEDKMLATKILQLVSKKDADKSLKLVKKFSTDIDNWALCDTLGMQSLQGIRATHQKEIFELAKLLNTSKNFWQRRLSLVLVEHFTKQKSLHTEIQKLIKPLEKDEEYYVKKAVVWINKNFAKGK